MTSAPGVDATPASTPATKHFAALDGVRGMAVLMVFLFHYLNGARSSNVVVHVIGELNRGNWTGVVLFFVLSGFLITGILWDSHSDEHWWRKFFARRSLRIFPLYFLALLLVLLAAIPFGSVRGVLHGIWIPALFLENIPHLAGIAQNLPSPLPTFHFWSIAVEEQFYLIWPFLLAIQKNRAHAKLLCVATFLVSLLFRIYIWESYPPEVQIGFTAFLLTQAGALAAGGWLAVSYRGDEWPRILRFAPWVGFVGLTGFAICGIQARTFYSTGKNMITLGLPLITLFFAALVAQALTPGVVCRFFSNRVLRWLGVISYGIYIFHVLLAEVIEWLSRKVAGAHGLAAYFAVRLVIAAVVSVSAALLSFHFYEKQFLRLKKYFVPVPNGKALSGAK